MADALYALFANVFQVAEPFEVFQVLFENVERPTEPSYELDKNAGTVEYATEKYLAVLLAGPTCKFVPSNTNADPVANADVLDAYTTPPDVNGVVNGRAPVAPVGP
jgi:hypothetical protein